MKVPRTWPSGGGGDAKQTDVLKKKLLQNLHPSNQTTTLRLQGEPSEINSQRCHMTGWWVMQGCEVTAALRIDPGEDERKKRKKIMWKGRKGGESDKLEHKRKAVWQIDSDHNDDFMKTLISCQKWLSLILIFVILSSMRTKRKCFFFPKR